MTATDRVTCYVGLGSNLDTPHRQVKSGLEALKGIPSTRLLAASSLYASRPLGPADQPDFCNAVAALDTRLPPLTLLEALLAIELLHGRTRGTRWGPRTLDLDLLLYGDVIFESALLKLPHPSLPNRDFVLYPLAEIAPTGLVVPGRGSLEELLASCPRQHLKELP